MIFSVAILAQVILVWKRFFRAVLVGPHAEKNPTFQISKANGQILKRASARFRFSHWPFEIWKVGFVTPCIILHNHVKMALVVTGCCAWLRTWWSARYRGTDREELENSWCIPLVKRWWRWGSLHGVRLRIHRACRSIWVTELNSWRKTALSSSFSSVSVIKRCTHLAKRDDKQKKRKPLPFAQIGSKPALKK